MTDDFPTATFHFSVSFGGAPSDDDAWFQEVGGIAAATGADPIREGGENRYVHQLSAGARHPRLTLERGTAPIASSLVTWCRGVLEGNLAQPIETRVVRVTLRDAAGAPLRQWSFDNAYPVLWTIGGFQSNQRAVAIERIELSYRTARREL